MEALIPNAERVNPDAQRSFVDQHISEIAFIVSTLVQFILKPLTLMLGLAAGMVYSMQMNPDLRLGKDDKIIGVTSAVFAIVGASAALIQLTPAGSMGGFIFQMVPYASAFMIGTSTYRAVKNFIC